MRKEFIEPCVWITHMFVCISSSPDFHGAERERDCRLDFWGGSTEAHCTVGLPLSLMTFPPAAPSPPFSIAWQCHLPPTQSLCTGVSLGPECPPNSHRGLRAELYSSPQFGGPFQGIFFDLSGGRFLLSQPCTVPS